MPNFILNQTAPQVLTCLYCRADLTPAASKGLSSLSLDWLLAIATHRPELLTPPVLSAALELWKVLPPPQLLSLVCPRNLVLLDHSPRPQESWQVTFPSPDFRHHFCLF